MSTAVRGVRGQALIAVQFLASLAQGDDHTKGPERHEDIEEGIGHGRRSPFGRAGDEAQERVARMRNRGIRQHAFHVGLGQSDDAPHDIERPASTLRSGQDVSFRAVRGQADPSQRGQANRLGAGRQEGRDRSARTLVSVRRPRMQRHRRNLESKPRRHQPYGHQEERGPAPGSRPRDAEAMAAKSVVPVTP